MAEEDFFDAIPVAKRLYWRLHYKAMNIPPSEQQQEILDEATVVKRLILDRFGEGVDTAPKSEEEKVGDTHTEEHGYIEVPFRRHWTEAQLKEAARRDKAARQNNPLKKET